MREGDILLETPLYAYSVDMNMRKFTCAHCFACHSEQTSQPEDQAWPARPNVRLSYQRVCTCRVLEGKGPCGFRGVDPSS